MLRVAHFADVHFRSLARHAEYKRAFTKMMADLRENVKPDIIVICGDIVHSKTQGISPELIDHLTWWFNGLASICDVHVILGNHDGNLMNAERQDAISPIVNAINDPRIHLYKKSGVYSIMKGVNLCVFSLFDEKGWQSVKPVEGDVNIALYHGSVRGSTTDVGWELESDVGVDFFDGFDFVFLGDIHRQQYLDYREVELEIDEDDLGKYPGATIVD